MIRQRFTSPESLITIGGIVFIFTLAVSAVFVREILWIRLAQASLYLTAISSEHPAESLGLVHRRLRGRPLERAGHVRVAPFRRTHRKSGATRPHSPGRCLACQPRRRGRECLGLREIANQVSTRHRRACHRVPRGDCLAGSCDRDSCTGLSRCLHASAPPALAMDSLVMCRA